MQTVAVLGAGDLGATVARRLVERELARRVFLVDPDEGKARGKALDIAQSGPVEKFDAAVEGRPDLKAAGPFDAAVVADHPELDDARAPSRAGDLMASVVAAAGKGPLVIASERAPGLIETAVAKGFPRERVVGSSPVALAAALRRLLAAELKAEPREVSVAVLGLPPDQLVMPPASATLGGVPIHRLSEVACRRALDAARGPRGPVALAAAAVRVLKALGRSRTTVLPVIVFLQGEYGHRGVALCVPARLAGGRLEGVLELALEPVERVAFDNAAQRRLESRGLF